jgi:hypothetical protein
VSEQPSFQSSTQEHLSSEGTHFSHDDYQIDLKMAGDISSLEEARARREANNASESTASPSETLADVINLRPETVSDAAKLLEILENIRTTDEDQVKLAS